MSGIQYWHEISDCSEDDEKETYDDSIPVFDRGVERPWSLPFSGNGELDFNN